MVREFRASRKGDGRVKGTCLRDYNKREISGRILPNFKGAILLRKE